MWKYIKINPKDPQELENLDPKKHPLTWGVTSSALGHISCITSTEVGDMQSYARWLGVACHVVLSLSVCLYE